MLKFIFYLCIDKNLRINLHYLCEFACLTASFLKNRKHLYSRYNSVACSVIVVEYNMPRLLSPKRISAFKHFFYNVSVSYACLLYVYSVFISHNGKSHIAHNRSDYCFTWKSALFLKIKTADSQYFITVYQFSVFIDSQTSVSVSVKGKTYIRSVFNNKLLQ